MLWALLILMMVVDVAGNLCMTHGMKQVGAITSWSPAVLGDALRRAVKTPWLGVGLACFTVAFVAFLALLSMADLSFVLPVTSITYVLNTLGARYLLGERVTASRWAGTACIVAGVTVISLGSA